MSDINVNGDNNRTAGRDYHEHQAPDVCPNCENRLLSSGREYCRHCENEYREAQRREKIRQMTQEKLSKVLFAVFSLFIISALILHYGPEEWKTLSGAAMFLSLIGCGIALTACENYTKKKFYSQE